MMKKLATIALTTALAASVIEVPTAFAETVTAAPTATTSEMNIMDVKTGQFDENGLATFQLNVTQEGYYRLVGNSATKSYETAIATDVSALKDEPYQAASKLRRLTKGTYLINVKGTPGQAYRFKMAERTFDLSQPWPMNNGTVSDGYDKKNVVYMPYYTERKAAATLTLNSDQHIRFYGVGAKPVKALRLTNKETGKTYTAKKISVSTFSSNAPDGTYEVTLRFTDDFLAAPTVGKMRLSYTLGKQLSLNDVVKTDETPFNTFTFNPKKDTKISFTLMPTKGKGAGQRFSIYDKNHNLVKRVHLLDGQTSRQFVYTVKAGRYSIVANNMKIQTIVKDANASKFTFKKGVLVHTSTGKVVKGYQVYKEKLYKDGVLTKGRVKYGKVPDMKLYRDGVLEKGLYVAKGYKYVFKDGVLLKGAYTDETENGVDAIFEDGVLSHLIEMKNGKLYDNGKLHKGRYVLNRYEYEENEIDGNVLRLFINGELATGYEKATYKGETYLFKDGYTATAYYEGKVYAQGKLYSGFVFIDDKYYHNHTLFTGVDEDYYYEDGVRQYALVTKDYEAAVAEAVAVKSQIGTKSNEEVAALLKEKTNRVVEYLDNYDRHYIYDAYGEAQYDDVGYVSYKDRGNIIATIERQLGEIDDVAQQLSGAADDTRQLLQEQIDNLNRLIHY